MKELGTKLRDARKAAGLYQEGLARRVGVSVDTVRRWESGAREPRASNLQSLAGVLGTDVVAALFVEAVARLRGDDPGGGLEKRPVTGSAPPAGGRS